MRRPALSLVNLQHRRTFATNGQRRDFSEHLVTFVVTTPTRALQVPDNQGSGGEGSRTPVLMAVVTSFYMFSRAYDLEA